MTRFLRDYGKGLSRGRLQVMLACGVLIIICAGVMLYFNLQLEAGGRIKPSWISYGSAAYFIIFGLFLIVSAWRRLRQGQ